MEITLLPGATYTAEQTVTFEDTAASYKSGAVEVFATPAMIALMENAAWNLVQQHLPETYNSVGVEVCITHLKATPKGARVSATATLTKIDGRRLYFDVTAHDEKGEIGRGTHSRHIIENKKFMEKLG